MPLKKLSVLSLMLGLILALAFGCTATQKASEPVKADWLFHDIADVTLVQQYAKVPQPEGAMIIDSRPYKPKYVNGHIPTAVSIPDSQFDKMTDKLPQDKNTLLIFYCGGLKCPLSHKSARKAEELGYTNVKVFADGFPGYMKAKGSYAAVSVEYVADQLATNEAVLVDARPKKAKYDKGYIPSAISIPDSEFDKLQGKLPAAKNTLVIFYCGGYTCPLSHKSARKAGRLGYTNVKVFDAGFPAWKQAYGAAPAAVAVKAGTEEGSIEFDTFGKILNANPQSIYLVDVRDPDEFAAGHFQTAVNIPVGELEEKVDTLPADKPIVFVCSTGARSGESYYMLQDIKPELKKVYYLEAEVEYSKDGSYTIKKSP
jgi:rhodanese-related sulfurtransferase